MGTFLLADCHTFTSTYLTMVTSFDVKVFSKTINALHYPFLSKTRQSVACNARRHPVVEHQDTCTCNIIIIAI